MPDRKPRRRRGIVQEGQPQFQPQNARTSNQRRIDQIETIERFLIVCEGEKTEPNYFRGFHVPGRVVEIVGTGFNTLTLVEKAISFKEEARSLYDQVWCVFDRDTFPDDHFSNAVQKAKDADIKVAYSNEAFELWYLLHFDDHRSALSRHQYSSMLKQRLGHEYLKNDRRMYDRLQSRQEEAIHRAESLMAEYGSAHQPHKDNPCTTVHLLVKALRANITPK